MRDHFHIKLTDDTIREISSIGLAHLGDAVYELLVRAWLCEQGKATGKGLHRATVEMVKAPAQAARVERILPLLSEEVCSAADAMPMSITFPAMPAAATIRRQRHWRRCLVISISRTSRSESTSCLIRCWERRSKYAS